MTPRFQQKSITKGERVFMTTRTRQLNISFQWFGVFRFCNGVVWKLALQQKNYFLLRGELSVIFSLLK